MSEQHPNEFEDVSEENPYQASTTFEESRDPPGRSPFIEFYPIPHFAIYMVVAILLLIVPLLGVLTFGMGILGMLRSWFWVYRIGYARRQGIDYPVPPSRMDLFSGSLAIGFGVAIVWPIAYFATCVPMFMTFSLVASTSTSATESYLWIPAFVTICLVPIVASTVLCTWIIRATLPPYPKING
jgi:hypothetical protein